jgi:hypothetical protein
MIELPFPPTALSPNAWTEEQDEYLRQHYMTQDYAEIARVLGKSAAAVRNRRYRKLPRQVAAWTEAEVAILQGQYQGKSVSEDIDLNGLALVLGRHKTNVSRKARELGLTDKTRQSKRIRLSDCRLSGEQLARSISARFKAWMAKNNHPRGMLGKKHTRETLELVAEASRQRWADMNDDEKAAFQTMMLKRRVEVHGRVAPNIARGSWKAGWREIGGVRKFYRSRWEANYARYLQWLKERGEIADWKHEAETFWFDAIKRGVRSYLPDFRVTETSGAIAYHEVKGWMDDRSRTAIRRMEKYHPDTKLVVIDSKQYRSLASQLRGLIPGWE